MNKFGIVGGLLGAIIAVGLLIGYLGGRPTVEIPPPAAPVEEMERVETPPPAPGRTQPKVLGTPKAAPAPEAPVPAVPVAPVASPAAAAWEEKVDEILSAEGKTDAAKAQEMMTLFPQLTPDAQSEVAQHLSNLVADDQFGMLAGYVTNAALDPDVLEVFIGDLMNRPNTIKLPLILEVARNETHPNRDEARDLLELFLEEDYGTDWGKWQTKMQEWLRDNPD
jgi:hypothetical protein